MLKDFVKVADMPQEVIEKYQNQVPAELLQIWQEDGLGTFLDNEYITKKFELDLYRQAVAKQDQLAYDECFGFVPLLALGGFKDVDHMDRVKVLEHIYLMYQLTGGVMDD
ncbi:T6SS immunity protein Tdi1 domain-containing protein [Streptococcus sp.]|uniref:T6SS immunity protein Tdi1 domain-containing protein n=1 Tax=Streptococcus sp. TaxID=1306 RepID=UPI0026DD6133|nr:T6SS immunity protein Tdi1 domain-containing protein [Streptococcus sp.]MDO4658763.1 DUF1851 domain-containing protein [Streptococcus sp.]